MGEFTGKSDVKPYDLSKISEKSSIEQFQKDLEALSAMEDATGEVEKVFKNVAMSFTKVDRDDSNALKKMMDTAKKEVNGSKLDSKMKKFMNRLFQEMADLA